MKIMFTRLLKGRLVLDRGSILHWSLEKELEKKMCIQSEFSTEWHVGTVSLRDRQSLSQSLP